MDAQVGPCQLLESRWTGASGVASAWSGRCVARGQLRPLLRHAAVRVTNVRTSVATNLFHRERSSAGRGPGDSLVADALVWLGTAEDTNADRLGHGPRG
jgi:hypothetical protein